MTNTSSTENLIYRYITTGTNTQELTLLNALRTAITDIRSKPWILPYILMDVLHEPLVTKYQNELAKFSKWFMTYDLPVVYGAWLQTKEIPPFIAVRLISETEVKNLKGIGEENMTTDFEEETDFINSDKINAQPFNLVGPFSPNYSSTSGTVTLPVGFTTDDIFVGECLKSANGALYPVLSIIDSTNFTITTDIRDNFTNSSIVFQNPNPYLSYNFFFFDQTFEIMCVTGADSAPLFWLTALVKFILLKYRRDLLEKYNLGLSSISMGKSELLEIAETNVQLLTQPFVLETRIEQRILIDATLPIKGIQGNLHLKTSEDTDFEEEIIIK